MGILTYENTQIGLFVLVILTALCLFDKWLSKRNKKAKEKLYKDWQSQINDAGNKKPLPPPPPKNIIENIESVPTTSLDYYLQPNFIKEKIQAVNQIVLNYKDYVNVVVKITGSKMHVYFDSNLVAMYAKTNIAYQLRIDFYSSTSVNLTVKDSTPLYELYNELLKENTERKAQKDADFLQKQINRVIKKTENQN